MHQLSADVGLIADGQKLTNSEKLQLLESTWEPPDGFQWPYSERMDRAKVYRKYLGPQHFTVKYSCFRYSVAKEGVFCASCVLFAPVTAGGVKLDRLVKRPLQKFNRLTGDNGYLSSHLQNAFHEDCVARASAFSQMMHGQTGDVAQQLGSAAAKQRQRNRRALERIIKAIELHGRLGLPLRGHDDCGELPAPAAGAASSDDIDYTQGNMRAFLQIMVACNDDVLKQHLATTGKMRRTYPYISTIP